MPGTGGLRTCQKSLKTWYSHKHFFTETAITLERRYKSVVPVYQSALFWSTRTAYPTKALLQHIDSQAKKFGRLTAQQHREGGQTIEEFNKESA
eukprot:1843984-Amphidinium_carterae.1